MEEQRFFQYLASERQGEIMVFDKIEQEDGINFVSFKNGSRCNEELILPLNEKNWTTQLMAEIDSPQNCWGFNISWVGREEERWSPPEESSDGVSHLVQPFIEGRKKVVPIPPRPTKSNFGKIDNVVNLLIDNVENKHKIDINNMSPVNLMLDKAKKFGINIEMNLTISLPSKSLYGVISESFENGEDQFIEYIINNIDNHKIKESLKIALYNAYTDPILEMNSSDQK